MESFDYLAAVSLIVSAISLALVLVQLHDHTLQRQIDADLTITGINQQLITLGFAHPELFAVLDGQDSDPVIARRYLQLWFNVYDHVYTYRNRGRFGKDLNDSLERELRSFLQSQPAQLHWRQYGPFYPLAFQSFINSLLPAS